MGWVLDQVWVLIIEQRCPTVPVEKHVGAIYGLVVDLAFESGCKR